MKKFPSFVFIFIFALILVGVLKAAPLITKKKDGQGGEKTMNEKKVLMIIAPENFRDEELFDTQKVLKNKGVKVEVSAKQKGAIKGIMGGEVKVEKTLDDLTIADYAVIVFIGGPGAEVYFEDQGVLDLAKKAYQEEKTVAAICIAPVILGNAEILEGKKATVWSSAFDKSYIEKIQEKGAQYLDEAVVVDGRIITANGPEAATEFGEKILETIR